MPSVCEGSQPSSDWIIRAKNFWYFHVFVHFYSTVSVKIPMISSYYDQG